MNSPMEVVLSKMSYYVAEAHNFESKIRKIVRDLYIKQIAVTMYSDAGDIYYVSSDLSDYKEMLAHEISNYSEKCMQINALYDSNRDAFADYHFLELNNPYDVVEKEIASLIGISVNI